MWARISVNGRFRALLASENPLVDCRWQDGHNRSGTDTSKQGMRHEIREEDGPNMIRQ